MGVGKWIYALPLRLRSLIRRHRVDEELEAELRYHIERKTEANIASGMTAGEARRAALLDLRGIERTKEECRDTRHVNWIQDFIEDSRYGLRMLRKAPAFTTVAVLMLALGIGANVSMFSVIDAVLLRPLPYNNPNQLVRLASTWNRNGVLTSYSSSAPDFFDCRDQNRSFSSMFTFYMGESALTGRGEAKRVHTVLTTSEIFSTLQAHPALGREFRSQENRKGADHVVILSHPFWQGEFNGSADAIGKTIDLDSEPYLIIGVMPADFRFPLQGSDALIPIGFDDKVKTQRGAHYLRVLGRLKPRISLARANDDLSVIMAGLRELYPDTDGKWGVRAERWSNALVGNVRPALLVLLGAVGLVALIACANVSNLLLARATLRHHELAMRRALGATRDRLVRQVLTEGLLLALLAGGTSLLLARAALVAIVRFGPADIPRLSTAGLNGWVLAFTLAASILTAVLFTIIPAIRLSAFDISGLLKISASHDSGWLRNTLLTAEMALSILLLVSAGLLVRSFVGLLSLSPGFDPSGLLTIDVSVPEAHYKNSASLEAYWDQLLAQMRELPSITSVSAVTPLPLSGDDFSSSFRVEGRDIPQKDEPSAELRAATPGYFRAMAIPLRQGRAFTDSDRLGAARVLLISELAAHMFFPKGDAIGQRIHFGARGGYESNEGEIVGIVGDVRHFGLDVPLAPTFYVPLAQAGDDGATLVIRTKGSLAMLAQPARALAQGVDRDALVSQPVSFEALVSASLGQRRFYVMLLGLLGALALVLAAIGLYGVLSYVVAQRTREIGIRMAIGATRGQILAMVIGRGMQFTALGLIVGLLLSMTANRALRRLLYGVSTTDPVTILGAVAILLIAAVLACYIPARRAMRVDPMIALRYE